MEYHAFLDWLGMDDADVIIQMNSLPAPVLPNDNDVYPIFSKIHGIGLASSTYLLEGEEITTLLEHGVRQVGARYINHSDDPNAVAEIEGMDLIARAVKPISVGEEITMCYANNMEVSGRMAL